ncbi:transposase [Mesorhizobium amorphae]
MGNWAGRACFHLKPIAEHMRRHLADADRLFMDETTAPVRSRTRQGQEGHLLGNRLR